MNPKKLARKVIPKTGVKVAEETYRKSRIYGLQVRHGFPARGLRVIATTGTNGKTTTSMYINEILKAAGHKTAMFTTAVIEIAGKAEPNRTHRTVPVTAELMKFFKQAKQAGAEFVILEASSQALHQHKFKGVPIELGIITNLTQDHLDYHGTMERYAEAKARLFNRYTNPVHCILNADDEWYDYYLMQSVGQVVSYGESEDSTERIQSVKQSAQGTTWTLRSGQHRLRLSTTLPGIFNVYNASAAATAALALGLPDEAISRGVESLLLVPGRMERIDAGQSFKVLVDFAITPDALEKALSAARAVTNGKVRVVFGATGDRDKSKRPIMGQVAAEHADDIYLTDDETYNEDPGAIRDAVYEGIKRERAEKRTKVIPDRREAIKQAFADAGKEDTVILAGLGHEDSRNMGGALVPWDDREVAKELLNSTLIKHTQN